MNKLTHAVKALDLAAVTALLDKDPKWATWHEPSGKNALHYLCAIRVEPSSANADTSLDILKLLLERGAGIDSVHQVPDEGDLFPATPLWYAYARGRNERLVAYLLEAGADPEGCMFAIAWNDDVESAALFHRHGTSIDPPSGDITPFTAAYLWRRFAVAEWFLDNGAAVDHPDADGNTALFYAIKRRYNPERIELLLRHGADPERKNHDGVSPRDLAVQNRQRKLLSVLDSWPRLAMP
jgi:ankyrin repeat protein